jgi:hypothetical protein
VLRRQRQPVAVSLDLEMRHWTSAMPKDLARPILETAVGRVLQADQARGENGEAGCATLDNGARVGHGIKRDASIGGLLGQLRNLEYGEN